MADVVVTMKIMPENPEVDLGKIKTEVDGLVKEFGGEVGKTEEEPIAFGLVALNVIFVMDEALGSTDDLEEKTTAISGVQSVEVTDVRRAIG